jgi:hypothetical protein
MKRRDGADQCRRNHRLDVFLDPLFHCQHVPDRFENNPSGF